MKDYFRFLINVDECLNSSAFDMFFYKNKHNHRLYTENAKAFSDEDGESLYSALADVHMFINKHPFEISRYQMVFAMRTDYEMKPEWNQTLLYRLLKIRFELDRNGIYFRQAEEHEKSLDVIMYYDADMLTKVPEMNEEYNGDPFNDEYSIFCSHYGIDDMSSMSADDFRNIADKASEPFEKRLFYEFLENNKEVSFFKAFVSERIKSFHVHRAIIDKQNRSNIIVSMFRILDFVTCSAFEANSGAAESDNLEDICLLNWKRVSSVEKEDIIKKYGEMLVRYNNKLTDAEDTIESSVFKDDTEESIPQFSLPLELNSEKGNFSNDSRDSRKNQIKADLNSVVTISNNAEEIKERWLKEKKRLEKMFSDLESDLECYAIDLSQQYVNDLVARKRETEKWSRKHFAYTDDLRLERSDKTFGRNKILEDLKAPQMSPSLKIQDKLQAENQLEQTSMDIDFFLSCLNMVKIINFILLLIFAGGAVLLHYTLLQAYVFTETMSLTVYLVYCIAACVMMALTFYMPMNYFKGKIRKSLKRLEEKINLYLTGYFDKADHFRDYINSINKLDYLTRYIDMLQETESRNSKNEQERKWHIDQIKRHIKKIDYFINILELFDSSEENKDIVFNDYKLKGYYEDNPLYWPDERGE